MLFSMTPLPKRFLLVLFLLISSGPGFAQFVDQFNGPTLDRDQQALNGWATFTGDGKAQIDFRQKEGYASIEVDATNDQQNIWWAIIKRAVSPGLNLKQVSRPNYELRMEARVRSSHAPRRLNLHLNTQRTTDFHSHLMEYEIGDTTSWHTISMTTKGFDARPGDTVYAQMALMDWGLEQYRVDVDYFRVDVVNLRTVGPDQGVQLPYHPPIPDLATFSHQVPVAHDAIIDLQYPDLNFNQWSAVEKTGETPILTVSGTQYVIMRWDLSAFAGQTVPQAGLLELATYSHQRSPTYEKDFGMMRVVEIMAGDPSWNQGDVTLASFTQGRPLHQVLNSQMIIDVDIAPGNGSPNLITISQPVLQRLVEGKTLGIALLPLGAVNASFYASENQNPAFTPKLHFRFDGEAKQPNTTK